MSKLNISINIDAKCAECNKGGASESGICMTCATAIVTGKPMKSATGKAIAERWRESKAKRAALGPIAAMSLLQKGE